MSQRRISPYWQLPGILVASLILVLSLGSCSDSSTPTDPNDTSTKATLAINMVDDPTEEICELWVYIRDIRVKPDGQPPMLLGTDIGDYELLELQDGPAAPLGKWVVDGGTYQFIEILLDESLSSVIEVNPDYVDDPTLLPCLETPTALQIPSAKFKVNGGPFTVNSDTTVTIDFDAKNSLKRKGGSQNPKGWQLKPKVSIVGVDAG